MYKKALITIVEITLCRHCQTQNVINHGRDKHNVSASVATLADALSKIQSDRSYTPAFRAQILAACQERASMRGAARIFGISQLTLANWLKAQTLPPIPQTLRFAQETEVLELDELWFLVC